MAHYTRLRVYQLGSEGASFSISVNNHFTLVEARLNEYNSGGIEFELNKMQKSHIDTLHITSWDEDHCKASELALILNYLKPNLIECPSYIPDTDNGKNSLKAIEQYEGEKVKVTPFFVNSQVKKRLMGIDVFYNPLINGDCHNDNSVVKLFRVGSFQILSLGDCESEDIAQRLMQEDILKNEVDVLILPHHGASEKFTTPDFLKTINPRVAICCSNYGNKYGHPLPIITQRLKSAGIDLYNTKKGDIIIKTVDKHSFNVANYTKNNNALDYYQNYYNKTSYIYD